MRNAGEDAGGVCEVCRRAAGPLKLNSAIFPRRRFLRAVRPPHGLMRAGVSKALIERAGGAAQTGALCSGFHTHPLGRERPGALQRPAPPFHSEEPAKGYLRYHKQSGGLRARRLKRLPQCLTGHTASRQQHTATTPRPA